VLVPEGTQKTNTDKKKEEKKSKRHTRQQRKVLEIPK
jgi:hypothetical protein